MARLIYKCPHCGNPDVRAHQEIDYEWNERRQTWVRVGEGDLIVDCSDCDHTSGPEEFEFKESRNSEEDVGA